MSTPHPHPPPHPAPEPEPPLLELRDASVVRDGVPILDRVSLTIPAGEHTAVIGPNGSGKSTLVKLLTCQIYPVATGGGPPVRVFGRARWNVTELRSRMGIVSADLHQRFVSGSSMGRVTGLEAVIAGFFSSELLFFHHSVTPGMRRRAEEALARVGAAALASRRIDRMSTGEVRRVLIARALVHEPTVLVLDEPTTGLDLVARRDFLEQMRALARAGTTLVLITHHVEEIVPEIERVVLLSGGRIAAHGAPDAVLTPERLGEAYGAPVRIRRSEAGFEMRID